MMGYMLDGWQTENYISEVEKQSLTGGYVDTTSTGKTRIIKTVPPAPVGWICPKCGAGMAPWATRCPCQEWKVTY